MKFILALSLCLMLPMHAMDMQEKAKDDTYLLSQTAESLAQKKKQARRKKITGAVLVTLLAATGTGLTTYAAYNTFEPITYDVLPYADQLPAGNATCTYQHETAHIYQSGTSFYTGIGGFETAESDICAAGHASIAMKYCECKTPPCTIILETCQDKDPLKKDIFNACATAVVTQLAAWLTYMATSVTNWQYLYN